MLRKKKDIYNPITVLILASILFTLAFLLYSNTLTNGYVYDDFSVIKENRIVKLGFDGISTIFTSSYRYGSLEKTSDLYRPLSLAMFAIEWHLFPDNPMLGHLINILLYAFTGLVLFFTLRKIFSNFNIIFPFITTLLFIVHPIHTEVVANIKSRDEILSFLFILLSLNFLWNYISNNSLKYLFISLFFYFLSFLSKESAITFILIFPLTLYFFSDISIKKNLITSMFYIIPLLLFLFIRNVVIGNFAAPIVPSIADNLLMGAPDISSRLATAIMILGKYLSILFFPHPLVSDYSFKQIPIVTWSNFTSIIFLIIYLGIGIFAIVKLKSKNIFAFVALFFLITIFLYSNILFIIGSSFGERFLYLPSLAFCIGLAYAISILFNTNILSIEISDFKKIIFTFKKVLLITIILSLVYSVKTYSRNNEWESNFLLYSADITKSSQSAHLHYNYAVSILTDKVQESISSFEKKRLKNLAIEELKTAISIYPNYAEAYDRLASVYFTLGNYPVALKCYNLALKYNSGRAITNSNIGMLYFSTGQFDKAKEYYIKAVSLDSTFADAWMNLGSTYGMQEKFDSAKICFKHCLKYAPENKVASHYLDLTNQKKK